MLKRLVPRILRFRIPCLETSRIVPALALLLVAAPGSGSQIEDESSTPKAVLEEVSHDFGEVARASVLDKTFVVRNEGTAALEIRQVLADYPARVVDFSRTIPPHGEGVVKVELDTDFVDGELSQQFMVLTNDRDQPTITLTLKLDSKTYVFVEPGKIRYVVPRFFEGHGAVEQLVWAEDPEEFKVVRVESPYPYLKTAFQEAPAEARSPDHEGSQWIVQTRLSPDASMGPLTGHVVIYVDHPKQQKASIPLSGFVRPLFAVTPAEADLGDFEIPAGGLRWELNVKHFGIGSIEIQGVESEIEGLEFVIDQVVEGREFLIYVLLPADMPKGPFAGKIVIHTSSDKEPRLEAPIHGTVL